METIAQYVTCKCQHCDGRIEFDANLLDDTGSAGENALGPTIDCPHCKMSTILFVPRRAAVPVGFVQERPPGFLRRHGFLIGISGLVAIVIGVLFLASRNVSVEGSREGLGNFIILVLSLLALVGGVCLYFLPAIIAKQNKKKNQDAIAVLNLLAGWTFVGWVVALVWATTKDD